MPPTDGPPLRASAILLSCVAASVARLAQGAPLDALSLGLHFAASLALLRVVASVPMAARRRRQRDADHAGDAPPGESRISRQARDVSTTYESPAAPVPPTQRFDDVVADPAAHPDCLPIPSGSGVWWRAPYAGVVFGALLSAHAIVVPLLRSPWTAAAAALSCVPLFLFWLRGRATRRARRGVALLLTPEALILRDARGSRSAAWRDVRTIDVVERIGWDTLRGAHRVASVVVERVGAEPLVVSEDDLAHPPAAVVATIDRYRGASAD